MKSLLPTEKEIQNTIVEYLTRKKWMVMRMNSGAYKTETGYFRGHDAGTPDLMAFKNGNCDVGSPVHFDCKDVELYFIEVKRSKKHRATELQVAKMKELEAHGAKCLIATSIEDLKAEGL